MGIAIVMGLALVMILLPIINKIVPNFKFQEEIAQWASLFNKNDAEIERLNQHPLVRSLVAGIEKRNLIDRIAGERLRKMYNGLNKKENFAVYLSKTFFKVLAVSCLPIFMYMLVPNKIFLIMVPLGVVLFFMAYIYKIKEEYQKRQNILLRDLPELIDKMTSALAAGRPLERIFEDFSDHCSPILSRMLMNLVANLNTMPMRNALRIFAMEVDYDEMYDFISVVNVIVEKGYHEAESNLQSIKDDLDVLRKKALEEKTKGDPAKFNMVFMVMLTIALVFPFLMLTKLFSAFTAL
jgi:Flp pilus assembly protein TadB